MPLGAYVLVRYADDVRDERLNLGVLVWHPVHGIKWRFLSSFDKVQAIRPSAKLSSLKDSVNEMVDRLSAIHNGHGRAALEHLSREYSHGLQVSTLFPARLSSLEGTIDRLYSLLVEPEPTAAEQSDIAFEMKLSRSLQAAVEMLDPVGRIEHLGIHGAGGMEVDFGTLATVSGRDSIWRPVTLRTTRHLDRLTRVKSAVMDIQQMRGNRRYLHTPQYVVLELPRKPAAAANLRQYRQWLNEYKAEPVEIQEGDDLTSTIRDVLGQAA